MLNARTYSQSAINEAGEAAAKARRTLDLVAGRDNHTPRIDDDFQIQLFEGYFFAPDVEREIHEAQLARALHNTPEIRLTLEDIEKALAVYKKSMTVLRRNNGEKIPRNRGGVNTRDERARVVSEKGLARLAPVIRHLSESLARA